MILWLLSCGMRERKETGKGRQKSPHTYSQEGFSRATSTGTTLLKTTSTQVSHPHLQPKRDWGRGGNTALNRATAPCSHLSGQHHPWLTQSSWKSFTVQQLLTGSAGEGSWGSSLACRHWGAGAGLAVAPAVPGTERRWGFMSPGKGCGWGKVLHGSCMPTKGKDISCWKGRFSVYYPCSVSIGQRKPLPLSCVPRWLVAAPGCCCRTLPAFGIAPFQHPGGSCSSADTMMHKPELMMRKAGL